MNFQELSDDEKVTRLTSDPDINLLSIQRFRVVSEYSDDIEKEETQTHVADIDE